MRVSASLVLVVALDLGGCSSAGAPSPRPPTPSQVTALEGRALRDSLDVEAQIRLASAYRAQARTREALAVAERALARQPTHARAALLVGLSHEDLGHYDDARTHYLLAMRGTRSPRLRAQLNARLVLLQRRQTQAQLKLALTREAELAATAPRPRTLAVFPLAVAATDSMLGPLGRALTAMLITDLSQTQRLTVLDRTVVQLLLDEIQLSEKGYVDEATAARGGRLLGAERIAQGSLASAEELLRLEVAVTSVAPTPVLARTDSARAPAPRAAPRPGRRPPARPRPAAPPEEKAAPPPAPRSIPVAEADRLDRLFELEKRAALRLYQALGIELTPAERAEVTRKRTENLQALLAYGRGLQASDADDFATALRYFSQATGLDPGFAAAREQVSAARAVVTARRVTTDQLATAFVNPGTPASGALPVASPAAAMLRDPTVEVLGTEGVIGQTSVELVIRRPGGAQ